MPLPGIVLLLVPAILSQVVPLCPPATHASVGGNSVARPRLVRMFSQALTRSAKPTLRGLIVGHSFHRRARSEFSQTHVRDSPLSPLGGRSAGDVPRSLHERRQTTWDSETHGASSWPIEPPPKGWPVLGERSFLSSAVPNTRFGPPGTLMGTFPSALERVFFPAPRFLRSQSKDRIV
jgi:hypothetical protein